MVEVMAEGLPPRRTSRLELQCNRNAYSVAWRAFRKSVAHGWVVAGIRVSTIRVLELTPSFSIAAYRAGRARRGHSVNDRQEKGLRLAGLPEGCEQRTLSLQLLSVDGCIASGAGMQNSLWSEALADCT